MDFSFTCKYCNELYEITFESLSPEIKDLIIKIKNKDKKDQVKNDGINKSTLFSENPPYFQINGIDMSFVKVDRISIGEIISHLDIILDNKICDNCYKKFTKINEDEIKKIEEEISQIDKVKSLLQKDISLLGDEGKYSFSITKKYTKLCYK